MACSLEHAESISYKKFHCYRTLFWNKQDCAKNWIFKMASLDPPYQWINDENYQHTTTSFRVVLGTCASLLYDPRSDRHRHVPLLGSSHCCWELSGTKLHIHFKSARQGQRCNTIGCTYIEPSKYTVWIACCRIKALRFICITGRSCLHYRPYRCNVTVVRYLSVYTWFHF